MCYTNTWQREEEMTITSTEHYHSSQVETIKVEAIEDEDYKNVHSVIPTESEIVMIEESFVPENTNIASKDTVGCIVEHCEAKTKMKQYRSV